MTKKELIELIEEYPDDAVITCSGDGRGFWASDVVFDEYTNKICNINGVPRIKYTKASTILSSTVNLDRRTKASKIPPGMDKIHTIQNSDTVTFKPSAMVGIICNK